MSHTGSAPLSEMNTTPLIDVLLVLLIMFIITIPIQTHSVQLDLPGGPPPLIRVDPVKNKIVIDQRGSVFWNGEAVDLTTLRLYLDRIQEFSTPPELHIQPDGEAPYAVVDEVLAVAKRAEVTRMGFVGNEKYGSF